MFHFGLMLESSDICSGGSEYQNASQKGTQISWKILIVLQGLGKTSETHEHNQCNYSC